MANSGGIDFAIVGNKCRIVLRPVFLKFNRNIVVSLIKL